MDVDFTWDIHPKMNVKFEVPTTWNMAHLGEDKMILESPDKLIHIEMSFVSMSAVETGPTEAALMDHIKEALTDVKITKPVAPKTQHGLNGFGLAGTGVRGTTAVEWFTFAVSDRRGHFLVALAAGEREGYVVHGATLFRIIGSIQPINPTKPTATA